MPKPQIIRLNEATYEIRQACDECHQAKERSPFFFITGAGISHPPIPLARTIIEECKKRAQAHPATSQLDSQKILDEYSYWFSRAFPQAHHRRRFFKQLISNNYISPANFRLAHLLLNEQPERRLANLVFTLNFDDFLTRALSTFGKHHIVCDHPATTARVDLDDPETPQIIHVHGTYHFYDCRNLADEIANAAHLSATSISMPSLLDSALRYRSPIVVGYSGWEGDIVMSALYRRLNGQSLPFNLYWFCYSRKGIDGLPGWLKFHENVRFVAPDEPKPDNASQHSREPNTTITLPDTKFPQGTSALETLPAHTVFEALIREFGIPSPRISQDPLGFFATQMEKNLPQDDLSLEAEDIYQFKSVVRRVRTALDASAQTKAQEQPENLLEPMREAIRTSRFQDAVFVGGRISRMIPPEQREDFLSLLLSAATGLDDNSSAKLLAYDLMSDTWSLVEEPSEEAALAFATALRSKVGMQYRLDKFNEALAAQEECINLFEHYRQPPIVKQVFRAEALRGFILQALGRIQDSIAAFQKVRNRYTDLDDPESEGLLVFMIIGLAESLLQANHPQEAITALDSVLERYKSLPVHLHDALARVHNAKTEAHAQMNDLEGALKELDRLLERFSDSRDPAVTVQVYNAKHNKGVYLLQLNKSREALALFTQLTQELQATSDPTLKDLRLRSLDNRGITHFTLGEYAEALSLFDEMSNLIPDRSKGNQHLWADVLCFRGACLLDLGRTRESLTSLEALVQQYADTTIPHVKDRVARGLTLLAIAYQRQNETDLAKATCERALNYVKSNTSKSTQDHLIPTINKTLSELTSGNGRKS